MTQVEHLEGKKVQGWLLTNKIGRGADGIVYAGVKEGVERAIKLYFPDSLKKNGLVAAHYRLEAQLQLVITDEKRHDNLVDVYAGGEDTELDTLYLVMVKWPPSTGQPEVKLSSNMVINQAQAACEMV